jgi:hypothetical protein
MTNEGGTDGDRSPPRPTRSTFCVHRPQKDERMKIRAGRAPRRSRARRPSPGRPSASYAGCRSSPRKVEGVGPRAEWGPRPSAKRTPAELPGRPRNHLLPSPGPECADANRPPKPGRPRTLPSRGGRADALDGPTTPGLRDAEEFPSCEGHEAAEQDDGRDLSWPKRSARSWRDGGDTTWRRRDGMVDVWGASAPASAGSASRPDRSIRSSSTWPPCCSAAAGGYAAAMGIGSPAW